MKCYWKRNLLLILIFLFTFGFISKAAAADDVGLEPFYVQAQGAILLEQKTGKVLYSKNADEKLYPASTTKILTALLAIENGDLAEMVTVGEEINILHPYSSTAELKVGENISLADLVRGLMLPSGNDAANTIAVHIVRKLNNDWSISIPEALDAFSELMNERTKQLGALNSSFKNPHGFHEDAHYTTAYDLAMIAKEAMNHQFFREVIQLQQYELGERFWRNTNELINTNSTYHFPSATGVKTGYTTPAGYCLVSSASHGDLDLISVVLNTTPIGRWSDSTKILNHGMEDFVYHDVIKPGQAVSEVRIANAASNDEGVIKALAVEGFKDILPVKDLPEIKKEIIWKEELLGDSKQSPGGNSLLAPLRQGQVMGKVAYILHDQTIAESDLIAARNVKSNNFLKNLIGKQYPAYYSWVLGLAAGWALLMALKPRRKKKLRRR